MSLLCNHSQKTLLIALEASRHKNSISRGDKIVPAAGSSNQTPIQIQFTAAAWMLHAFTTVTKPGKSGRPTRVFSPHRLREDRPPPPTPLKEGAIDNSNPQALTRLQWRKSTHHAAPDTQDCPLDSHNPPDPRPPPAAPDNHLAPPAPHRLLDTGQVPPLLPPDPDQLPPPP